MKTILLLGPPGSGKGTVSDWLVAQYGFMYISTGKIFRTLANKDTAIAQEIRNITSRGELIPDHLTNQIIKEELSDLYQKNPEACLVLDGYPRTLAQAKFLEQNFVLDKVVLLDCPTNTILRRLTNRLVCQKADHSYHKINKPPKVPNICDIDQSVLYQRKDDQKEVILKRIAIYEATTAPLIQFYKEQHLLEVIDATKDINATIKALINILKMG